MGLLWVILIGLVVGAVAKLLIPGDDPGGIFVTALIGIVGSVVATYLGQYFGFYRGSEAAGFGGAVIGSMLLLGAFRSVARR